MCIRDRYMAFKFQNLRTKHRQETDISCKHTFYPRMSNLTTIVFDVEEMKLLVRGINYNLSSADKNRPVHEVFGAWAISDSMPTE